MIVRGSRTGPSVDTSKPRSIPALLVSVTIHLVLVAVVVAGAYGRSSSESRPEPGIVGSADHGTAGGVATAIAAPPTGPSLNPADGARYVGHYSRSNATRASSVLQVDLVNDGESEPHWALTLFEGQGPVHKLTVVARDTFAFQLAPKQFVVFRRVNDSITAISIRRRRDTSWAERVASAP
jgi:hypothetical protein